MGKVSDLFGIKRNSQEAFKVGRILNRLFQFEKGYENHHYRWCYKNPIYKDRKEFIKKYFAQYNIEDKIRHSQIKFIDHIPIKKLESKQSIVALERVNHKIMGDTQHKQKDPDIDVTYPIVAYNPEEDLYYVWDGNSRIIAALILGEETIKCQVIYP